MNKYELNLLFQNDLACDIFYNDQIAELWALYIAVKYKARVNRYSR